MDAHFRHLPAGYPVSGLISVEPIRLRDHLAAIWGASVDLTTLGGLHPALRLAIKATAERVL